MSKYIDADKLHVHDGWLEDRKHNQSTHITFVYANEIDNVTVADVRENIHGKWIRREVVGPSLRQYICSACGEQAPKSYMGYPAKTNFCPHCGAEMRRTEDSASDK